MSNKHAAIPLITYNEKTNKYTLEEKGLKVIYDCNTDVSIVAVIGNSRTGKSYLFNRIGHGTCQKSLAKHIENSWSRFPKGVEEVALQENAPTSFAVGHTHNSTTHGIYIYPCNIPFEDDVVYDTGEGEVNVLIIDTEGLNSPERSAQYDHKIYALAMLLSSVLVYNTGPVFDRESFDTLAISMRVLQKMHTQSSDKEGMAMLHPSSFMPSLFWVMRNHNGQLDFYDSAVNAACSPTECLKSLMLKYSTSSADTANILTLSNVFDQKKVQCFALETPSADADILAHLDSCIDSELNPKFVTGCDSLIDAIIHDCLKHPKRFEKVRLEPHMVVNILDGFVQSLNKNSQAVPDLIRDWKKEVSSLAEAMHDMFASFWSDEVYQLEKIFPEEIAWARGKNADETNAMVTVARTANEEYSTIILEPFLLKRTLLSALDSVIGFVDEHKVRSRFNKTVSFVTLAQKEMEMILSANDVRIAKSGLNLVNHFASNTQAYDSLRDFEVAWQDVLSRTASASRWFCNAGSYDSIYHYDEMRVKYPLDWTPETILEQWCTAYATALNKFIHSTKYLYNPKPASTGTAMDVSVIQSGNQLSQEEMAALIASAESYTGQIDISVPQVVEIPWLIQQVSLLVQQKVQEEQMKSSVWQMSEMETLQNTIRQLEQQNQALQREKHDLQTSVGFYKHSLNVAQETITKSNNLIARRGGVDNANMMAPISPLQTGFGMINRSFNIRGNTVFSPTPKSIDPALVIRLKIPIGFGSDNMNVN